jgi:hypothetical protein
LLALFLLIHTVEPQGPQPTQPAPTIQLPPDIANAVKQTITSIVALTQKGVLCSAALTDSQASLSIITKDIEQKLEEGKRIDAQIAETDQQLRASRPPAERTQLLNKRRDLQVQRRGIDDALLERPQPSPLKKRFLDVQTEIANNRQCVAKARADLDAFAAALGSKSKL